MVRYSAICANPRIHSVTEMHGDSEFKIDVQWRDNDFVCVVKDIDGVEDELYFASFTNQRDIIEGTRICKGINHKKYNWIGIIKVYKNVSDYNDNYPLYTELPVDMIMSYWGRPANDIGKTNDE